eukprot:5377630-Amphidinium_carterae.4
MEIDSEYNALMTHLTRKSKGKGYKGKNRQNQVARITSIKVPISNRTRLRKVSKEKESQVHNTKAKESQCWGQGPVYQLDATDLCPWSQAHSCRTRPILSRHRAVVRSQDSGIQGPSYQRIISQSSVRRCGQKWSLMYDSDYQRRSEASINHRLIKIHSTMEENQCYARVKPPPHKSWIMSLHSEHGARMIKIGKHSTTFTQ